MQNCQKSQDSLKKTSPFSREGNGTSFPAGTLPVLQNTPGKIQAEDTFFLLS
jgi:hypothetical protein